MNITICGGGNLGHVVSGVLGSQNDVNVFLLTRHPEQWNNIIEVKDLNGKIFTCNYQKISDNPKDVIPLSDMVILCLPGFAIHDELMKIKPYLKNDSKVGSIVSSTGFFFEALDIMPKNIALFGFQRVPFISRTVVYGKSADLLGYKESLNIAVESCDNKESLRMLIEKLFITPTKLLHSHYEASLTNSNPLLHPARLYTMWKDWDGVTPYDCNPYFYSDWTNEASELLIAMDKEFQTLLKKLPVRDGAIPPVLDYYESTDAISLTQKLHSIKAFKGITSPMCEIIQGKFIPDFSSRYFQEDFPFGMRFILETAIKYNVSIPIIEKIYTWGNANIKKHCK